MKFLISQIYFCLLPINENWKWYLYGKWCSKRSIIWLLLNAVSDYFCFLFLFVCFFFAVFFFLCSLYLFFFFIFFFYFFLFFPVFFFLCFFFFFVFFFFFFFFFCFCGVCLFVLILISRRSGILHLATRKYDAFYILE